MLAIVQARMSSTRLPGKVLMDMCGRALLGRVVDRLSRARSLTRIVVATSEDRSDQAIADFCEKESIRCHRGPLDDVTRRFHQVATLEAAESFVRISGDSPLIDPELVDRAVHYYRQGRCDLATNVLIRSFPKGQSVEVVGFETFQAICEQENSPDSREHVTTAFYRHPERYRIVGFTSGIDAGRINLSVDTVDDFVRIEMLIKACGGTPGGWRDLLTAYHNLSA